MAQTSSTNGASAGMPPAAEAPGYQLVVNTQYLKDLSFENPRAHHREVVPRDVIEWDRPGRLSRQLHPDCRAATRAAQR